MDLLKDAAKNISLYDVKAYVRKAQNVAMNLTEMEAKVREATNNEPWGAPLTLMQQIAAGTYNYREREEIIGFIFRRFTEKAANEWRQIYKSLQLLDYLLKNGSERIIDDVRANITLIQMLKSFHYIDSKGRDQGINVRNRAKNLIAFLNDDNLIRSERKKSRANAKKFGGVSSAAFGGALSLSPLGVQSGYEDLDFTNRVYGDGGVYGARYDDPASLYENGQSGNTNGDYEEYDPTPAESRAPASSKPTTGASKVNASSSKAPEVDLLGDLVSFGGQAESSSAAAAATTAAEDDDDDDFDDFQAAPSQAQKPNLANLYNLQPAQIQAQPQNTFQQQNTFQLVPQQGYQNFSSAAPQVVASKPNNDAFSSLFSTAKSKSHTPLTTGAAKPAAPATKASGLGLEDVFGDFNSKAAPESSNSKSNSGEVDLLSF